MKWRVAVLFRENRHSIRTREGLLEKGTMRKEAMEQESCKMTTGEKGVSSRYEGPGEGCAHLVWGLSRHQEEHEQGAECREIRAEKWRSEDFDFTLQRVSGRSQGDWETVGDGLFQHGHSVGRKMESDSNSILGDCWRALMGKTTGGAGLLGKVSSLWDTFEVWLLIVGYTTLNIWETPSACTWCLKSWDWMRSQWEGVEAEGHRGLRTRTNASDLQHAEVQEVLKG